MLIVVFCSALPNFLVIILTTPPAASEPYKVEAEPFKISILSTLSILTIVDGSNRLEIIPLVFTLIPSIKNTTLEVPLM